MTSKVIQPTCQNFHAMYTYKASTATETLASTLPPTSSFAVNIPDYAYLQLELITSQPQDEIEMDLICWKILLTKGMSQFMGTMGESIPTDIIHISNPEHESTNSKGSKSESSSSSSSSSSRRRHSYNHPKPESDSFLSSGKTSHNKQNSHHSRSSSLSAVDFQSTQQEKEKVIKPHVWIRVPESDLTTVWTALSGFSTSLDTGNYGVIDVGIRVVRASRYLMSITGPLRSKW